MTNFHADLLILTVTRVEAKAVFQAFREVTGQNPRPADRPIIGVHA